MPRDNFSKRTISVLAERVGFLCSNPKCRFHTVGPNTQVNKSTRTGKAAHITAASILGPRYDAALTAAQRSHINNGIWLCSICADIIDKDSLKFPTPLLNNWKTTAELEMFEKISGKNNSKVTDILQGPFLEVDLILNNSYKIPRDKSDKNPGRMENGIYVVDIGNKPIIHWEIIWVYSLVIYNNSSYPAFNVKVKFLGDAFIATISTLRAVNNIRALEKETLKITYIEKIESSYIEADKLMGMRIPSSLSAAFCEVTYFDEARHEHLTIVTIDGVQLLNEKAI